MTVKFGRLGGSIVPEPEQVGYVKEALLVGASTRTLNGTLRSHYAAQKYGWNVPWRGLTESQKNLIVTELIYLDGTLTWVPPEGGSFNVAVMPNPSWHKESYSRWAIDARLEQI